MATQGVFKLIPEQFSGDEELESFTGERVFDVVVAQAETPYIGIEVENLKQGLKSIDTMVKTEHEYHSFTNDFYHGYWEHIRPLLLTAIATFSGVRRLTKEGRETVNQASEKFCSQFSLFLPDLRPEYKRELQLKAQSGKIILKPENFAPEKSALFAQRGPELEVQPAGTEMDFNEEDFLLLYTALACHDMGRFTGWEHTVEPPFEKKTRRKTGHEQRSQEVVDRMFDSDPDNPYREYLESLAQVSPQLFAAENLEATKAKIKYLIFATKYQKIEGEQETRLQAFSDREREKMRFLGNLTLSIDIGTMQIKGGTFDNFVGLIAEYLDDIDLNEDELLFTSAKGWISDWTKDTAVLANNVNQLYQQTGVIPSLSESSDIIDIVKPNTSGTEWLEEGSEERLRWPQLVSREMRWQFLAFLRDQEQLNIEEKITWGQLKRGMDHFQQFIQGKIEKVAYKDITGELYSQTYSEWLERVRSSSPEWLRDTLQSDPEWLEKLFIEDHSWFGRISEVDAVKNEPGLLLAIQQRFTIKAQKDNNFRTAVEEVHPEWLIKGE